MRREPLESYAAELREQWLTRLLAAGYPLRHAREALEQINDAEGHIENEMLQRAANGPRQVIGRAVWMQRRPYRYVPRQYRISGLDIDALEPLDCKGCVRRIYGRLF